MSRVGVGGEVERHFLAEMGESYILATPGLRVQAYHLGELVVDVGVGDVYPAYDWASLTKIVFSASALMLMHDQGLFALDDPVTKWVPWFPAKHPARLRELLSHSAGLTWWHPFYVELLQKTDSATTPESAWAVFEQILCRQILRDLEHDGLPKSLKKTKCVYSDLDLFLLGAVMQNVMERSLSEIWAGVRGVLNLEETNFHRDNQPIGPRTNFAPTEDDRTLRHRLIQGEVHDQNTWALRGVAPHAGLFGPIGDLSRFGLLLRAAMRGERSGQFATSATVGQFTRRAVDRARGDWALDFMLPSRENSSCGPLFSPQSVGHLGFTGTSLWFDPKRDLLVTILSNRIFPSVENIAIRALRPKIHTWIAEAL